MTRELARPATDEPIPIIPSMHAVLQALQQAGKPMGYIDLASALGITPGTLRERLHRLRSRGVLAYKRVGNKGVGRESLWFPVDPLPPLRIVTKEETIAAATARINAAAARNLQARGFPEPMTAVQDDSIDSWPVKRRALAAGSWTLDHKVGVRTVFELAHR